MGTLMKIIAILSLLASVALGISYAYTSVEVLLTLAITFGVIAYHFIMRLLVGFIYSLTMKNKADYHKRWYRVSKREFAFYQKLKVKKWKGNIPTYDKASFDIKTHSLEEIVGAMCQAELVHETIIPLSFLPVICGIWFSPWWVFLITSLAAAVFDSVFIIVQRYNRQRIIKLLERKSNLK